MSLSFLSLILVSCTNSTTDTSAESTEKATPDSWARSEVLKMETQVQNSDALQSLNALEDTIANIENELLLPWAQSWKSKNVSTYQSFLIDSNKGLGWSAQSSTKTTKGGIEEHSWQPTPSVDAAAEYLAQFTNIDSVQLEPLFARTLSADTVEMRVRFQLRAQIRDTRQHDRGTITLKIQNQNDAWKIVEFIRADMDRLRSSRAPIFSDATQDWNLHTLPVSDRKEAIRRGGYALAAVDYNDDGRSDLLVGHYGTVQLLKNTGTQFVDVTKEEGLSAESVVKSAAIADMDGDGDKDILVLRFVETSEHQVRDFVAYENMGEGTSPRFQARRNLLPRSRDYDRAMPLTLADFNNDGTLDIYIGFPGIRDFTSGIQNRERPQEQASQGLWLNKGDWNFTETTSGIIEDNSVYAHAALASDLDGDGTMELLVVDDSGRINPLYKRTESGDYVNVAKDAGIASSGMSMGITTGDFNGDGLLDIMSTNVTLLAGTRLLEQSQNVSLSDARYAANFRKIKEGYDALALYQNNGDGTFTQIKDPQLAQWHGQAAASGEWIDYNHDGLLDYYLPNGLWTSGDEQLDSLFFRFDITSFSDPLYTGIKTQEDFGEDVIMNDVHGGSNYVVSKQEIANPILRLLRSHRNSSGKLSFSLGGHQHNALFRNNGDGTFTEVGYLENADRIEDGYIVTPFDVDNDGRQDLVLRNTDPALEHSYAPVVLLKNNHKEAKTACVKLPNTKSPFGARVTATINGASHVREIHSVNGAVQGEPIAMFGLGTADKAEDVTIHWPDGSKEVLGTVASCTKNP